jgi:sugar-specific transcriptional regulator TrmB
MCAETNNTGGLAVRPAVLRKHRDPSTERFHQALEELGLTDHEAQCYVAICDGGTFSAYEVSNRVGLPRPNVYAALKSLEEKGFAQAGGESPVRYRAVPPRDLFAALAARTATICEETAAELLARHRGPGTDVDWILHGAEDVDRSIRTHIRAARAEVWIKATAAGVAPFAEALRDAARRGLRVVLVLFDPPEPGVLEYPGVQVVPHEGHGGGCSPANRELFSMLVDESHAIIAANWDSAISHTIVNPLAVRMVRAFFYDELSLAHLLGLHGTRVQQQFGENLRLLRQRYRPENMEDARPSGTVARPPGGAGAATEIRPPADTVEARLRWFGLTDSEARVLLAIVELSDAATVAEITKRTSISKPNCYAALRGLEQKQVILPLPVRPLQYRVRNIHELFDTIQARIARACHTALEEAERRATMQRSVSIDYLEGAAEVQAAMAAAIAGAGAYIHLSAGAPLLDSLAGPLQDAAARGVKLQLLAPPGAVPGLAAQRLETHAPPAGEEVQCLVTDMKSAILAHEDIGRGGIATESRCLVFVSEKYLLHRFYLSEIAAFAEDLSLAPRPAPDALELPTAFAAGR